MLTKHSSTLGKRLFDSMPRLASVQKIVVKPAGHLEFIALMAFTMAMVSISISIVLPALSFIASDLKIVEANHRQLVVGVLFLGLGVGQLVYGPISDTIGRRSPMIVGFAIYLFGSLLAALADSFILLLFARFLQGLGAAGPRIMSLAIIRDRVAGANMAQVMSQIMMVFILVPVLAPSFGELILMVGTWRFIFWLHLTAATLTLLWFVFRQPETLPLVKRRKLRFVRLLATFRHTVTTKQTLVYTIASGLVFGSFLGYVSSSQQILQDYYGVGKLFVIYFSSLAASIGISSYFNSRLVMKFEMRRLCLWALTATIGLSGCFLLLSMVQPPPLWLFMSWLLISFLAVGTLFSNFHALAMEPMGRIAGMASSVSSAFMTFLSVLIAYIVGQAYNHSVMPLAISFFVLHSITLVLILLFDQKGSSPQA